MGRSRWEKCVRWEDMARIVGWVSLTPFTGEAQGGGMDQRRIVFVIFDGFQPLDLVGPHEVFVCAGRLAGGYDCEVVAPLAGQVRSRGGLAVHAGHAVADVDVTGIDTLVVAGGAGVHAAVRDPELVAWIAAAGAAARRVTSVCTGVFLLAAAGLVEGCRVTTHWNQADRLAREHPGLTVDCDPIFIMDGRVWTSAGVTAGMDLALALVEDDLGRDVAHAVAQQLVLFLRRPGSQSQFSVPLWSAQPSTGPIQAAVSAIHADPGGRHGIADLARHAGLSPRHLQRRFTAELRVPPAAYVERVRIEAARRALAEADDPVEAVARRFGFGTAETLRRAFHRHLGVSPSDYRDRFRPMKEYV
jgi:transcriptional regulator GlxA family with amidase domain